MRHNPLLKQKMLVLTDANTNNSVVFQSTGNNSGDRKLLQCRNNLHLQEYY